MTVSLSLHLVIKDQDEDGFFFNQNCGLLSVKQLTVEQSYSLKRERWGLSAITSSHSMLSEGRKREERVGFDGWMVER